MNINFQKKIPPPPMSNRLLKEKVCGPLRHNMVTTSKSRTEKQRQQQWCGRRLRPEEAIDQQRIAFNIGHDRLTPRRPSQLWQCPLLVVVAALFAHVALVDATATATATYCRHKRPSLAARQRPICPELQFLCPSSPTGVGPVAADRSRYASLFATVSNERASAFALDVGTRGGAAAAARATVSPPPIPVTRSLVFWENMICGATSRSIAQTIMHPANTMKTILQNARFDGSTGTIPTIGTLLMPSNFRRLTVGAGANFLLSMPHGAVNFAVLEFVRQRLSTFVRSHPQLAAVEERFAFGLDFVSSSISTITCSIVSTPQMMITDNIMAGNYPSLWAAITGLAQSRGILGFYSGWWPGLVGKIPSYAFTWTFFQQLKTIRNRLSSRPATDLENSAMGCMASAATVCLMIPMDTIKTRLVSQAGRASTEGAYTGIINCAVRIFREEGMGTFYRGLPPRLVSVVPMIGIQFGVYEFMKRVMLQRQVAIDPDMVSPPTVRHSKDKARQFNSQGHENAGTTAPPLALEEAMMEVAASPEHPFPAPQFSMREEATEGDKPNKPKR